MSIFRKEVLCPYCQTKQEVLVESDVVGDGFRYCDQEDYPGCGRKFAIKFVLDVRVSVAPIGEFLEQDQSSDSDKK